MGLPGETQIEMPPAKSLLVPAHSPVQSSRKSSGSLAVASLRGWTGLSAFCPQLIHESSQRQGLHAIGLRKRPTAAVNDNATLGFKVGAGRVKALGRRGAGCRALALNRPAASRVELQHEVNLGARLGAVEERLCPSRGDSEQVFNYEALPTAARHWMGQHILHPAQAEKGVNDAAVPKVEARRAGQALAYVPRPGRQTTRQQEVHQQIDVAVQGAHVDGERRGQLCGVQRPTLVVRQHGPQVPQRFGGQMRTK